MLFTQPLHRIRAIQAARLYFIDGKNKSDIAKELDVSRFKVARLINEAVEKGLVKFIIEEQDDIDTVLSEALCQKFKLNHAIVLSANSQSNNLTHDLGALAASFLEEIIEPQMKIGFAWGRVLSATADALRNLPPIDIVQVAGAHPNMEFKQNSIELVHRIASISQGKLYPIYLPMWVEDENTARHLIQEASITDARMMYDKLDVLVTGIGCWTTHSSCLYSTFPNAWREQLLKQNVYADICTTFLNSDGLVVDSPIDKLGFGLTAEQIKRVPHTIAIAGGSEKFDAILATLKGGWLSTLITDSDNAKRLLD